MLDMRVVWSVSTIPSQRGRFEKGETETPCDKKGGIPVCDQSPEKGSREESQGEKRTTRRKKKRKTVSRKEGIMKTKSSPLLLRKGLEGSMGKS